MKNEIPVKLRMSRAGNGFAQSRGDTVYVTAGEALAMIRAGQAEPFPPEQMQELERRAAAVRVPPPAAPAIAAPPEPNADDGESNGENDDPPSGGETSGKETPPVIDNAGGGNADGGDGDETDNETGTPLSVLNLPDKAEQLLSAAGLTTVEKLDAYTVDMELENLDGIGAGWAEHIRKARAAYQPAS